MASAELSRRVEKVVGLGADFSRAVLRACSGFFLPWWAAGSGVSRLPRAPPNASRRNGLLPQPGGFEGFAAVAVSLAANDPAVPKRPQVTDADLEWRATCCSAARQP